MGEFQRGSIWSDGATPPAADALLVTYVAGDEIFWGEPGLMLSVHCQISGTAPTSVDFQLEQSFDNSVWDVVPIPGNESITADAILRFILTDRAYYRFSAKRTGGAADTSLLALGYSTSLEAFPGALNQDGALVVSTAGTGTLAVEGDIAHDAVDTGSNPVKIGGHADTGTPAAVNDGDRVDAWFDEIGRLHVYDENGSSAAAGDVAHDGVDSGNPVKVGGRARTSQIAAVGNDDRTDAVFNEYGEQVNAGYNWTSDASQVVGEVADDAVDAGSPVAIGGIARSAQRAAVGALDRVKATFNVYGELVLAAYSWALNAIRTSEINPLSEQYAADEFEESAIVSGGTYYHYLDMAGYSHLTIIGNNVVGTDGQTLTLEATCQDDGTAPASIAATAWEDITQYGVDWLGSAAAANVNTAITFGWSVIEAARFKYVRIKYVTGAGAGDDAAHNLYARRTAV